MRKLVGLDGRPLDGDLVTPPEYMDRLGQRSGLSFQQREFLRKNLPETGDPDHLSLSQRKIKALRDALHTVSLNNLQLFALVAAMADRLGKDNLVFASKDLVSKMRPEFWPEVTVDPEGDVHVVMPGAGEAPVAVQAEPEGDVS